MEAFLLLRASFRICNFIRICSARSFLYSLFIEEASNSKPFSVFFTGFNFNLLFLISAIKSFRFVDTRGLLVKVGGGKLRIGGGGKKLYELPTFSDATVSAIVSLSSSLISYLIITRCSAVTSWGFSYTYFFAWCKIVYSNTNLATYLFLRSYFIIPASANIYYHSGGMSSKSNYPVSKFILIDFYLLTFNTTDSSCSSSVVTIDLNFFLIFPRNEDYFFYYIYFWILSFISCLNC